MTELTQRLPLELLDKILEHASVLEVLKFKQVNRVFRDAILTSPLIQHKIELYAAGLEYNAAAGISLADSKNALSRYRSSMDSLCPVEKRTVNVWRDNVDRTRSGGGIYVIFQDSVRLFALGSASRGIPHREWEIPLPVADPVVCCLCPDGDVIAFVERCDYPPAIKIHLRSLSDGEHHPAALSPTIHYSQMDAVVYGIHCASITSSRLVVLASDRAFGERRLMVWDWKRARLLFEFLDSYHNVEFIDDYRLFISITLVACDRPPFLALVDTEKIVGGAPMQTTFHLFPNYDPVDSPGLLLEAGMHKPSTAETLAPFYQDPIQRIAALYLPTPYRFLVFRVGALLELVESREGSEIGWDEWKGIVVAPSVDPGRTMVRGAWVSGCRLFAVITAASSPDAEIRSFDFSIQGRAKYSSARVNTDLGGVRCLSPTDARARIPRSDWFYTQSGHDSVVLSYWHDDSTGSAARGDRCYIWTF